MRVAVAALISMPFRSLLLEVTFVSVTVDAGASSVAPLKFSRASIQVKKKGVQPRAWAKVVSEIVIEPLLVLAEKPRLRLLPELLPSKLLPF